MRNAGLMALMMAGASICLNAADAEIAVIGKQSSATRPAAPPIDEKAAKLVRDIVEKEAWIERVDSMLIRTESQWHSSPEHIAAYRTELIKMGARPDPTRYRGLSPSTSRTDIAFDRHRIRKWDQDEFSEDLRIWNGKEAIAYGQRFNNKEEWYSYFPDAGSLVGQLFVDLGWLRTHPHHFWWEVEDTEPADFYSVVLSRAQKHSVYQFLLAWGKVAPTPPNYAEPEDFRIVGRTQFHGVDCHILDQHRASPYWRWYVGVEDGFLHGLVTGSVDDKTMRDQYLSLYKAAGYPFKTMKEASETAERLSDEERRLFGKKVQAELERRGYVGSDDFYRMAGNPSSENWLLDYKEVAPGCWFPMTQGYVLYSTATNGIASKVRSDEAFIETYREISASEVKVNIKLPDDLFVMEFHDGATVSDRRLDSTPIYKYKHDMTPAEWQTILTKFENRRDQDIARREAPKKVMESLIGKPAPELPQGLWLNSKRLKWSDFKGKIVVVEFLSEVCPARPRSYVAGETALLRVLHELRDQTDIVLLGVHAQDRTVNEAKEFNRKNGQEYPICIDTRDPNNPRGLGLFYDQCKIASGPYAMVVGSDGRIARFGRLADLPEVLDIAKRFTGRVGTAGPLLTSRPAEP